MKEISLNGIVVHLVKLPRNISVCKWSLSPIHLKDCRDLVSFILCHNAEDFLLMRWSHPCGRWWLFGLATKGLGRERGGLVNCMRRGWCNFQGGLSADLEPFQGLSLHARVISAIPPSPLLSAVRYTFLKGCFYPIKDSTGLLLPGGLSSTSSVWHLGSSRNSPSPDWIYLPEMCLGFEIPPGRILETQKLTILLYSTIYWFCFGSCFQ